MNKFLLATTALIAVPAVAQHAPNPGQPGMQPPHAMARPSVDRIDTRAEMVARTQRMFAMVDANRDGVLDPAELAAIGQRWQGARLRGAANGPVRGGNAKFDRIDSNHDGMINREEFARKPQARRDRDGDGQPDGARRGGGGIARLATMADANRDGRVTLQEATDLSARHFDMMDANRDGRLTADERAAGRERMRDMRSR